MKRVFDFQCQDSETMVSRILLLVHQGIDDAFPEVKSNSTRFAKTTFGDEPTANQVLPQECWNDPTPTIEEHAVKAPQQASVEPVNPRRLQQTIVGLILLSLGLLIAYLLA